MSKQKRVKCATCGASFEPVGYDIKAANQGYGCAGTLSKRGKITAGFGSRLHDPLHAKVNLKQEALRSFKPGNICDICIAVAMKEKGSVTVFSL